MTQPSRKDLVALVEHVAVLARLRFPPEQAERLATKARSVLAYVERLGELSTDAIEPTAHAVESAGFLRSDEVIASTLAETIRAQAPEHDGPYVQVPKVIDA